MLCQNSGNICSLYTMTSFVMKLCLDRSCFTLFHMLPQKMGATQLAGFWLIANIRLLYNVFGVTT